MEVLAITARCYGRHQDVLGGHERKLGRQMRADHPRIDHQPVHHVLVERQHGVGGQEPLRQDQAAVGAVVQGAFQPLSGSGGGSAGFEARHEPGQRADAFAAHRVPLVGHGRRADLVLFKGLFDFLAMLQQSQVGGRLVGTLGHSRQHGEHLGIDLPRVGLASDGVGAVEADLLAHELFQVLDLFVVAVGTVQGSWRGCRWFPSSPRPAGWRCGTPPPRGPAPGRRPRGKRVCPPWSAGPAESGGERQAGQVAVPIGERGQVIDDRDQPAADHLERFSQQQQVGVVGHEAARCAEVNDAPGCRAHVAVGVDVGHHVVPQLAFIALGGRKVDVVDVLPQLRDLLHGDGESPTRPRPRPAPPTVAARC